MKLIEVDNISFFLGEKKILKNISFTVDEGDRVAVVGHNGSGKSILLDIILKNIKPTNGLVLYSDAIRIGVVYDNFKFFPSLKVKEFLKFVVQIHNKKDTLEQLLMDFDLQKLRNCFIGNLSQGERKKLSIVTALINNPDLLIMDEPFANIDPLIMKLITIHIFKDRTVIFSTNEWEFNINYAKKIILIKNGKMISSVIEQDSIKNLLPTKQKIVFEYNEKVLDKINKHKYNYYVKDNELHVFIEPKSNLINKLSKITKNISIMDVGLIDYYLYNN